MKFGMGQPARRHEDKRFLTGEGRFLDDISLGNQAFAAVFRSPVSHARILELDVGHARARTDILNVYTYREITERLNALQNEFPLNPPPAPVAMPHLADETVRYVGQPVAFVVAESREAALDAFEDIILEVEELPVVTDPVAALEPGAAQLHPEAPGNLAYDWQHGDAAAVEALFATAAHTVSTPVVNQRLVVASMEPRGIVVQHTPDERWEAWVGCQGAHGMRAKIAKSLGVEPEKVRVHVPDVGGAFGMKLMDHPEYGLAALAAKDLGRPVKWIGERGESFLSDAQARDMRGTVEGAFDADGRCLAMRMGIVSGIGAHYSTFGVGIHTNFSAALLGGMYAVEAQHVRTRGAFTNTTPTDAYRGAGRPEAIYATERLMEAAARQIGIDPVEIRRRNLVTSDMLPHATPGGLVFDSLDTSAVVTRALARADHAGFPARRAEAEARGRVAGIGVTYYMERTGGQPLEKGTLAIHSDGRVELRVGTQSTGQGHETAWAQLVHENLGLEFGDIRLLPGDSDALPAGGGTGGSRSTIMASRMVIELSEKLVRETRPKAAEHLEAAEADIEFSAQEAGFRIAGTDRMVTLVELAAAEGGIATDGGIEGIKPTFPNGCHVCEIEIDRETGAMEITRYTAIDDFGRLVNPLLVSGQVHGGIAQGVGQVIGEAAVWDPDTGQPLTGSFMDYRMPRAADLPFIALEFEEVPSTTNPLGVKGCGEAGSVGAIPASALAVLDALRSAGAGVVETPYTPEKLWRALRAV